MLKQLAGIVALVLLAAMPAAARDHFVAPSGARPHAAPDGTRDAPWPSLQGALTGKVVTGGDRVLLLPGTYGDLLIRGAQFTTPVVIAPASPGTVHADSLAVQFSRQLTFRGLEIWPRTPGDGSGRRLVTSRHDSTLIRFESLDVRGSPKGGTAYRGWAKRDWLKTWLADGVRLEGPQNALVNSQVTGINFGVTTMGPQAEVRGNTVSGFAGDAYRGLGDGSVFVDNVARDCVKVNENHDDGFQSWARKVRSDGRKRTTGLVIERNAIMEWTGAPDHPLRCRLQGISLFDGDFRDVTIRNNLVVISAYHGIAVYGGTDVEITHNTVLHQDGTPGDFPWIMLSPHKDGTPAGRALVTNNVIQGLRDRTGKTGGRLAQRNAIVKYPARAARNIKGQDFRPPADSVLVDAADPAHAPAEDLTGAPRPKGAGPDLGAYEVR